MARTTGPSAALALALDERADTPLFLQIARGLSEAVRRGRIAPGTRLPGSRTLAGALGVHRNTVLAAYAELDQEGWIASSPARGTFVSPTLPEPHGRPGAPAVVRHPHFALAEHAIHAQEDELPRGTIVLAGGVPDVRLVPAAAIARAYRRTLRQSGARLLGYGDPRGEPRFRAALAAMLAATRGLPVGADDVLVTRGSQMALDLVSRVLLAPGSVVAVEALGYRPAWDALAASGARLVPVPVDDEGIDVGTLARLAAELPLRAVYVTPHHQYPTTVTLGAARRLALLELARRYRFAVIEDDYNHEFHYDGRPVLPLASADSHGSVLYVGTLSKILAPALRLGYLVAPRRFLEQATAKRRILDRQGDAILEHAVAELMEDGELDRHVRRTRRVYLARRDALGRALRRRLGHVLSFELPTGGMALWARVTRALDLDDFCRRARAHGVVVQPAKAFAFDARSRPFLRLGFAANDEAHLGRAVDRLASALGH
jgi:GntR family transcriptional regulator / MocR family aminotransferase